MGIEPATCCLRNSCSTTELHRPDKDDKSHYRSKYLSIRPCLNKPAEAIYLVEPAGSVVAEQLYLSAVHNLHGGQLGYQRGQGNSAVG